MNLIGDHVDYHGGYVLPMAIDRYLAIAAAPEVATATLLEAMTGQTLDPLDKALLCQRAEHRFAGMPCGVMDQVSSASCRAGALMLLDCRSLAIEHLPLADPELTVLIADSGVRHAHAGGAYAARRAQSMAAAANVTLIAGFVTIAAGYFFPPAERWVTRLHEFHFLGAVFVALVALMLLIGLARPRGGAWEHKYSGEVDLTPWRLAWPAALGLVAIVPHSSASIDHQPGAARGEQHLAFELAEESGTDYECFALAVHGIAGAEDLVGGLAGDGGMGLVELATCNRSSPRRRAPPGSPVPARPHYVGWGTRRSGG